MANNININFKILQMLWQNMVILPLFCRSIINILKKFAMESIRHFMYSHEV